MVIQSWVTTELLNICQKKDHLLLDCGITQVIESKTEDEEGLLYSLKFAPGALSPWEPMAREMLKVSKSLEVSKLSTQTQLILSGLRGCEWALITELHVFCLEKSSANLAFFFGSLY